MSSTDAEWFAAMTQTGRCPPKSSTAMLILLSAVDAGLGACLFGIPKTQIGVFRAEFGVPDELTPIGAISIGYAAEPPRDFSARRKPENEVVRRGRWS